MQCISTTASAWLAKVKGKGGYGLRRPTLKRAFTTLVISFCGILVRPTQVEPGPCRVVVVVCSLHPALREHVVVQRVVLSHTLTLR
jgi:hypothetical protein